MDSSPRSKKDWIVSGFSYVNYWNFKKAGDSMTEREALKLALEALENLQRAYREAVKLWDPNHDDAYTVNSHNAIADIREALAQPEQEPQYAGTARELFTNAAIERLDVRPSTKVYLGTPSVCEQPAQQQEPVAYGMWDTMIGKGNRMMMVRLDKGQDGCTVPLYATPPQPEPVIDKSAAIRIATSLGWEPKRKPLTDEELVELLVELSLPGVRAKSPTQMFTIIARAIEAAHGIKE